MNATPPNCNDVNEPGLKPVKEALQDILSRVSLITGLERLPIECAKGRILGESLHSPVDVPAYDNSAVDGYAYRHSDQTPDGNTLLKVAGIALAGKPFLGSVSTGHCLHIMTGAMILADLDTVIMQEQTKTQGNQLNFSLTLPKGQNVRYAGEDIQKNQVVLKPGKYLNAAEIGLSASLGFCEINVRRRLKIAIASTGDELIDPGTISNKSSIYDSNRYSLMAALDRPDIETIDLGILDDNPDSLLKAFSDAANYADLIISTGGVSVGHADHTKAALQQAGDIDFWKVAIKPGRPLAFGALAGKPFFGLPGNPVAVMVTLYQFVLPAIEKMLGIKDKPIAPLMQAKSLQRLRKKPGRTEVQRGIIELDDDGVWTVRTTGKQGSGILSSMSLANAFIIMEDQKNTVEKGDWVTVQPFAGLL